MLQAKSKPAAAGGGATGLWVPGMAVDGGISARAQEIARRREEMLGMLRGLPESEYELSLTDLVEKVGGACVAPPPPSDGKDEEPGRSASGRQAEQQLPAQGVGRPERRGSSRRRDSGGGSSFRSSSDGVLLNFYMPRSLARSSTAPRPARLPSVSGASVSSDHSKRERDGDGETVRCWSMLWDRRWCKSRRRDPNAPPNESAVRAASAAILKAAKHSVAPGKI